MVLMYPRAVKVRSASGTVHEYVRVVEAYREGGKVKQRVVADLGRKDLLVEILPKLRRLLAGEAGVEAAAPAEPQVGDASNWGPVLVVRALFDQVGLWDILDQNLGRAKGVPFADRAFGLVANRLIAPASEPGRYARQIKKFSRIAANHLTLAAKYLAYSLRVLRTPLSHAWQNSSPRGSTTNWPP